MKYYATIKHHSIIGEWYELNATTEIGAKREAWAKEGGGYIGHVVHVVQADSFEGIHAKGNKGDYCRVIGSSKGWWPNR